MSITKLKIWAKSKFIQEDNFFSVLKKNPRAGKF